MDIKDRTVYDAGTSIDIVINFFQQLLIDNFVLHRFDQCLIMIQQKFREPLLKGSINITPLLQISWEYTVIIHYYHAELGQYQQKTTKSKARSYTLNTHHHITTDPTTFTTTIPKTTTPTIKTPQYTSITPQATIIPPNPHLWPHHPHFQQLCTHHLVGFLLHLWHPHPAMDPGATPSHNILYLILCLLRTIFSYNHHNQACSLTIKNIIIARSYVNMYPL